METKLLNIPIVKLAHAAHLDLPAYASDEAAGMDLQAAIDQPVALEPNARVLVATGLAIALPKGYEAQIRPRSGLALKHGVTVLNSPGTIDSDYRGEIKIILINLGNELFMITPGLRVAQMIVASHERVSWKQFNELTETTRGLGGFGSTGSTR